MNKTIVFAVAAIAMASAGGAAARNLRVDVDKSHNLWWNAPERPQVVLTVSDTLPSSSKKESQLRFYVEADTMPGKIVFERTVKVAAGSKDMPLAIDVPVPGPGFYRCFTSDDGNVINETVIGYEPTNVVSLPDAPADFNEFWARAKAELAEVPADTRLELLPDESGKTRDMYRCTFRSWGGDTIEARVLIPKAPGMYPAIVYYNGYGARPWPMNADGNPGMIEMATSVRGQFYSLEGNKYGDWIRYSLDNPDGYYYKGAFMDAVRAVDVLERLPKVDRGHIYAEGGSQGGALTLAAAALSGGRLRAIAPYIPFLSDYPDYFRIVGWPASSVKDEASRLGLSDSRMYANLSYFDIKNFARLITCPVLMGIGLQDTTCPPHTNMSSYNLITSPKELVIYPECGHYVDYGDWNRRRDAFFKRWW